MSKKIAIFFFIFFFSLSASALTPQMRIVSLAPNITEMLFAIGAGDDVVAVDQDSDYPAQVNALPKVNVFNTVSVEQIIAQRPTLILAWGGGTSLSLIEWLRQLGMNVRVIYTPTLADIPLAIRALGALTFHQDTAYPLAEQFTQQLQNLKQQYQYSMTKPTVMIELSQNPLYVAAGNGIQSQIIQLCGGQNVFQSLVGEARLVTTERVLQLNPQYIIGLTPVDLSSWSQWPSLPAVKNQHLITLNADLIARPGPRILQGIQQVCQALHGAS